jgi:hypothetical protein
VGKKNPANALSCWPDYVTPSESLYAAIVLTACCNTSFSLCQLYTAAVLEDEIFKDMPSGTLYDLICEGLAEDPTMKKARAALGFTGG